MADKEILRIVDSMTPEEIVDVFSQEASFIDFKLAEARKVFSKSLYANRAEPYFFKPIEYRRKSGLTIVLQFFDRSNKLPKKQRLGEWFYFWFNYRGGISFIRPFEYPDLGLVVYFYTSHFVDRYRERLLEDATIHKTEAFNTFLCRNPKRGMRLVPCKKYPKNGWMLAPEGLCFVEVNGQFVVCKTFIPWSYLYKGQRLEMNDISQLESHFELDIPWTLFTDEDFE